jgi:cyclopropane-fatty-acyl-phospholipid synthase
MVTVSDRTDSGETALVDQATEFPTTGGGAAPSVAAILSPLVAYLIGDPPPLRVELWDGSAIGPDPSSSPAVLRVRSPDAVRRILWSPNELGLGRARPTPDASRGQRRGRH